MRNEYRTDRQIPDVVHDNQYGHADTVLAYRLHGRFFPMPRETFNVVIYTLLGMYKIIILAFNIIPWIAISIIG